MRDLILMAGIKDADYDKILGSLAERTPEDLALLEAWFSGVYTGPYATAAAIWNLREPAYWANLTLMGHHKLREQQSLKEALKRLRKSWRRKYGKETKAAVDDIHQEAALGE